MEKKIIECNINGFKMLYTAEINNMDCIGDTNLDDRKYLHIKCTVSSNKTENTLSYKKVYTLDESKLDTPDNIKSFVYEVLYDIDISYNKNRFNKKLTEIIKEYKSKNLNFDKLEEYFDNNYSYHYHLCNMFGFIEFIPINANIEFNTVLAIYPYYYNKSYNLHVKLTYSCTKWDDTFEYKINSVSHLNNKCDYEKATLDILRIIHYKGYVNPTIDTFKTVFDMVKYCFDNDLFKDIDQIENEMTMKEEEYYGGKRTFKI